MWVEDLNLKDYKMKRPKEGYNSEKERDMCAWSGVSEYELFYKNELIGCIYFVNDWRGKWHGYLKEDNVRISWNRRKDVFIELCCGHHSTKKELTDLNKLREELK
tara:strand:- start:234 stop:548 length:315 start_codon:yes stop_codon:yes gene_type:complete